MTERQLSKVHFKNMFYTSLILPYIISLNGILLHDNYLLQHDLEVSF